MSAGIGTSTAQLTGLPFVPQPAPDELLGSWLLRVAQLYGLGLATLMGRLGVRPSTDACTPHWFALSGVSINLDALSTATRLPQSHLAAMAPSACSPHWPEELGACARCLAHAGEAGEPISWSRSWMNPLATVCGIHGTWLTPVATRELARIRHAGDFGALHDAVVATPTLLDDGPALVADALWLQHLGSTKAFVHQPWGKPRLPNFLRIVDAVAREVISEAGTRDHARRPAADGRDGSVKDFAIAGSAGHSAQISLPTRLRRRQWVLARVAHVLRRSPEARTFHASWSAASVHRLALMRDWPDGALNWVCPKAAELVRRQDALRLEYSISPQYFKAYAALLSSSQ